MRIIIFCIVTLLFENISVSQLRRLQINDKDTFECECRLYDTDFIYKTQIVYKKVKLLAKDCFQIYFYNYPYEVGDSRLLYINNDSVYLGTKNIEIPIDSIVVIKFRNGKMDFIDARKKIWKSDSISFQAIGKFQKNTSKIDTFIANSRIKYLTKYSYDFIHKEKFIEVKFSNLGPIGFYTGYLTYLKISNGRGIVSYKYYYEKEGTWNCKVLGRLNKNGS